MPPSRKLTKRQQSIVNAVLRRTEYLENEAERIANKKARQDKLDADKKALMQKFDAEIDAAKLAADAFKAAAVVETEPFTFIESFCP